MEIIMAFMSWRALLLAGVAALGLVQLTPWAGTGSQPKPAVSTNCETWDREASQGIATLIYDNSPAAELRLDEALLQLRRARKNCRAGSITLAGHDYTSLHQTFPVSTGSIQPAAPNSLSAGR
jgi:hypothetical protein